MKKLILSLILAVAFSSFVVCDKKETKNNVTNGNVVITRYNDLKNNIPNADRVAIIGKHYGNLTYTCSKMAALSHYRACIS